MIQGVVTLRFFILDFQNWVWVCNEVFLHDGSKLITGGIYSPGCEGALSPAPRPIHAVQSVLEIQQTWVAGKFYLGKQNLLPASEVLDTEASEV